MQDFPPFQKKEISFIISTVFKYQRNLFAFTDVLYKIVYGTFKKTKERSVST